MKYIDAEKLKIFEEMLADIIVSSQGLCTYEACKDRAKIEAPVLIDSLQQEQPEVNLKKEINELWGSLNTGHEYVIIDSYQDFLGICLHCFELGLKKKKEE